MDRAPSDVAPSDLDSGDFIILIRHGQSAYNHASLWRRFLCSFVDSDLTLLGVTQAREAKSLLPRNGISKVVCSPLLRAKRTASIACEHLDPKIDFWTNCAEWMIAPTDVPLETLSESVSQSRKWSYQQSHNILFEPKTDLTKDYGFRRRLLQLVHRRWFRRNGLSPEAEGEFKARVQEFRRQISEETEGSVVVVGHARFFRLLLGGYNMKNGEVIYLRREHFGECTEQFLHASTMRFAAE